MEYCTNKNPLLTDKICSEQERCLALINDGLSGFIDGLSEELGSKDSPYLKQLRRSLTNSPCRAKKIIIRVIDEALESKS